MRWIGLVGLLVALAAGCESQQSGGSAPAASTNAPAADTSATYGPELGGYFAVQSALAADQLDGAKAAAKKALDATLTAGWKPHFEAIASAADVKAARGAFQDFSKLAIADATKVKKAGAPTVNEYLCPMAPPYGRWLQPADPLANPYWGAKMLRCGTKTGTVGG